MRLTLCLSAARSTLPGDSRISQPVMPEDSRHHTTLITGSGSSELTLTGRYMALTLERLLINQVVEQKYHQGERKAFILLCLLYHNLWDYRIKTFDNATEARLIDSKGMQHGYADVNANLMVDAASISEDEEKERYFSKAQSEVEGRAKIRGWTWFDALPPNVWPTRFILRFSIFEPGEIGGLVRDQETFEFIFSPNIFCNLHDSSARLLPLEMRTLESS
jgi:hypothetical protein